MSKEEQRSYIKHLIDQDQIEGTITEASRFAAEASRFAADARSREELQLYQNLANKYSNLQSIIKICKIQEWIPMYIASLKNESNHVFLDIINQYKIIELYRNEHYDCFFNDNFNDIFHMITEFFNLHTHDYDGYVIALTNFLEPVFFNTFLFPEGYVDEDGYLEQELLDYCNNIMTQVIKCYSEAGNITKIDTTTLDFNNNDTEIDGINEFLQENIADVVSEFMENDENEAATAGGGGIMVGGSRLNDKLRQFSNASLGQGFSPENINNLLEIFTEDVQMVYYILNLYIEEGYDPKILNPKWSKFYDNYVSLNYFYPEIFDNYSGFQHFQFNDTREYTMLHQTYEKLNDTLNNIDTQFLEYSLQDLARDESSSLENINNIFDFLTQKVNRLNDELDRHQESVRLGALQMHSQDDLGLGQSNISFGATPQDNKEYITERSLSQFAKKDYSGTRSSYPILLSESNIEHGNDTEEVAPLVTAGPLAAESESRVQELAPLVTAGPLAAESESRVQELAPLVTAGPLTAESQLEASPLEASPSLQLLRPESTSAAPSRAASPSQSRAQKLASQLIPLTSSAEMPPRTPATKNIRGYDDKNKTKILKLEKRQPEKRKPADRDDGDDKDAKLIGGQKGGDCRPILINAFIVLFAYKIITEFIHDIGTGDRGLVVKNNTAMYNAVLAIFNEIARQFKEGLIGQSIIVDDQPSRELIDTLGNEIADINEDKYMSAIIRTMIKHCPDMLTEFYYKPMYVYVCKHDASKTTASAYDVLLSLFREKIMHIFPKEDGWMIFANPNDTKTDIHLYVFKRPDQAGGSDVDLGFYTQDMGLEDIPLGAALRMNSFIAIYDSFFPGEYNDINVFFDVAGSIKVAYVTQITDALAPLQRGKIENQKISDSMELFTTFKGTDPLTSHKPIYGMIMDDQLTKLYLGYNPAEYDPLVDAFVYPVGVGVALDLETNAKLKELNKITYIGTIDSMNKLLSYWIGNDIPLDQPMEIVNRYTFITEPPGGVGSKIIGIEFIGPDGFIFKLFFGGASVGEVCQQMDAFSRSPNAEYHENSLIEQMKRIYNHSNFRFKSPPGQQAQVNNMKLAIIASFKSYGDEGQRLISEYISKHFGEIFFLTKDRVLLVETIKFKHPILGFTKSPHESFNNSDEIEDAKEKGISCIYTGIISNKKSKIEKIKNTFELLQAAMDNYDTNIAKLPPSADAGRPLPQCYSDVKDRIDQLLALGITIAKQYDAAVKAFNLYADTLAANGGDAAAAAAATAAANNILQVDFSDADTRVSIIANQLTNDATNKDLLNALVKYNGIIKQVLLSLKYVNYARGENNVDEIKALIDTQIRKAISIAIPDKSMLSQILAVAGRTNLNIPFKTTTSLVDVLKLLHNEKEFSSKVIESYEIACKEMIQNINTFISIIQANTYIQGEEDTLDKILVQQKDEIIQHYKIIIESIKTLWYQFLNQYKLNIVEEINKLQVARPRRDVLPRERAKLIEEIAALGVKIKELEDKKKPIPGEISRLDQEIAELVIAKNTPLKVLKGGLNTFFTKVRQLINGDIQKAQINKVLSESKEKRSYLSKSFANFLEESKNTLDTLCKANGKLIATDHRKDDTILQRTLSLINRKISSGSALARGGKKKTKQNKDQKKYTKRYKNKIYRKRSKKYFKIKRQKYTKRRK
jgi:hypothetical protein